MATWVKLLFSKIKNVKKRVWVTLSLVIGSTVIWQSLSDWDRHSILAGLGSEEANIWLGDRILSEKFSLSPDTSNYTRGFRWSGNCYFYERSGQKELDAALDYYFKAIKNRKAKSRVLALFNEPEPLCNNVSSDVVNFWKSSVASYISSHFKNNITRIENWIVDEKSFQAVVRFYYYREMKFFGNELIEKSIDSDLIRPFVLAALAWELKYDDFMNLSNRILENKSLSDKQRQRIQLYQAQWLSRNGNNEGGVLILNQLAKEGNEEAKSHLLLGRANAMDIDEWWPEVNKIRFSELYDYNLIHLLFSTSYSMAYYGPTKKRGEGYLSSYKRWLIWFGENLVKEVTLKPNDFFPYKVGMAKLYMEEKMYDKAQKIYEEILERSFFNNRDLYTLDAGLKLGDIYYQGLGVKQDLEQAKKYYGMVCDHKAKNETEWGRKKRQEGCDAFRKVNEKLR